MLLIRIALASYWVGLFVSTHLPPGTAPDLPSNVSDKHVHAAAYAVLACLLAAARKGRQYLTWATAGRLLSILVAYAVFEELTQIPVGRDAQWGDLAADLLGAVVGLAVFHAICKGIGARD